jgi:glucosamine--fructose-6-phosphate aminotransferase (isomerizing)
MDETQTLFTNILSLGEWATWKNCIDQVDACLKDWASKTANIHFRSVYLVGCGSSYYAGQVGKYFLERFAQLPAEAIQAFSFSHYFNSSLITKDTLVIGLSTTGKTTAACDALAFAHQYGATTLAITAVPNSKITDFADQTILTGGHLSVLVQTETYVQAVIALYLLALYLAEKENRLSEAEISRWRIQIQTARETTSEFLETQQDRIVKMVEEFQACTSIFVLGNGQNAGTSQEAALKVIEMAKIVSDGMEMEDFFHGRDRELEQGSAIFFLAPHDIAIERMFDFLTFTRKVGIPSIVLTGQERPELKRLTDHQILLKGTLDELATPLVYITPLYLFSYYLALKRGFAPVARRYPMGALYVQYKGSEYDEI